MHPEILRSKAVADENELARYNHAWQELKLAIVEVGNSFKVHKLVVRAGDRDGCQITADRLNKANDMALEAARHFFNRPIPYLVDTLKHEDPAAYDRVQREAERALEDDKFKREHGQPVDEEGMKEHCTRLAVAVGFPYYEEFCELMKANSPWLMSEVFSMGPNVVNNMSTQ